MNYRKFDLYFAGSGSNYVDSLLQQNNCNRLLSYWNERKNILQWVEFKKNNPTTSIKLFMDSGAYTAFTKKVTIDIDEYIDFINSVIEYVDVIASLDVIPQGDNTQVAQQSYDNYLYIISKVKYPSKILPTFHQGDNITFLYKYLDECKVDKIALGGLVGVGTKNYASFFDKCFKILRNYPNVKVHAFGITTESLITHYPFTSSDSTRWVITAGLGRILTPWGDYVCSNVQSNVDKHINLLSEAEREKLNAHIIQMGSTPEGVIEDYKERLKVNMNYLISIFYKLPILKYKSNKKLF